MTHSEFLRSLRALVTYHRDCGINSYTDNDRVQAGLDVLDTIGSREFHREQAPLHPAGSEISFSQEGEKGSGILKISKIAELSTQIRTCHHCALHRNRQIDTAGAGGSRPALMMVGDWLGVQEGIVVKEGVIFGEEQEAMLSRMIDAIQLKPDDVFVTNIIKCSIPESLRPTPEQIAACIAYLKQQITILAPRIICAMGTVAAQNLVGSSRSLSQLRGRFHPCCLPTVTDIPVMPTYHPSFLLKNPEMKAAVWADLQAIQKELAKA